MCTFILHEPRRHWEQTLRTMRAKERRVPHLSFVETHCDGFLGKHLSQLTSGSEVLTKCLGHSIKVAWSAVLTVQLTRLWLNFLMHMLLKAGHLLLVKCLSSENILISLFVSGPVHEVIQFKTLFPLHGNSLSPVSGSYPANADVRGTLGWLHDRQWWIIKRLVIQHLAVTG